MAGDWIKMRKSLWFDGRVTAASRSCNGNRAQIVGALVALWSLADDYADDKGRLVGYTAEDIDAYVGVPGFCNSLPSDWYCEMAGVPQLPDYKRHNGATARERACSANRAVASRSRHGKRNGTVTEGPLPEKRREEKRRGRGVPAFLRDMKTEGNEDGQKAN